MRRVERLLVLKFYYIKNDSPDFNVTLELKSVLELKRNLLNRDMFVPASRSAGGAAELVSLNNLFSLVPVWNNSLNPLSTKYNVRANIRRK